MLAVPPGQTVTLERFSDSAGAYIKLDSGNPAVYKQLFRAAKAKLKLRIRATISNNPAMISSMASAAPEPDPLADLAHIPPMEPTRSSADALAYLNNIGATRYFVPSETNRFSADALQTLSTLTGHAPPPPMSSKPSKLPEDDGQQRQTYTYSSPTSATGVKLHSSEAAFEKALDPLEKSGVRKDPKTSEPTQNASCRPRMQPQSVDETLEPHVPSARDKFYAELASISARNNNRTLAQPFIAPGTSFTICCNICNDAIPNSHYHCSKCDDGDFDICEACYSQEIRCEGDDHWLVKRYVKDGKVTSSLTEKVAPKKAGTPEVKKEVPGAFTSEPKEPVSDFMDTSRTCNSCVGGESFNFRPNAVPADKCSVRGKELRNLHRLRRLRSVHILSHRYEAWPPSKPCFHACL